MRMNVSKFEAETYAVYMQRAGYATAYHGKYLNPPAMAKYCRNETLGPLEDKWPPGWDRFFGMCDQASNHDPLLGATGGYYDVDWVDSTKGEIWATGHTPTEYTTSLIGNLTVEWIEQVGAKHQPFLSVSGVRAPHQPCPPHSLPCPDSLTYTFHKI